MVEERDRRREGGVRREGRGEGGKKRESERVGRGVLASIFQVVTPRRHR